MWQHNHTPRWATQNLQEFSELWITMALCLLEKGCRSAERTSQRDWGTDKRVHKSIFTPNGSNVWLLKIYNGIDELCVYLSVYLWLSVGSPRTSLLLPVFDLPSCVLCFWCVFWLVWIHTAACLHPFAMYRDQQSMTFYATSTALLKGSIMWLTGRAQAWFCLSQHDSYSTNTEKNLST